jgi:hypothetical protein
MSSNWDGQRNIHGQADAAASQRYAQTNGCQSTPAVPEVIPLSGSLDDALAALRLFDEQVRGSALRDAVHLLLAPVPDGPLKVGLLSQLIEGARPRLTKWRPVLAQRVVEAADEATLAPLY